MSIQINTNCTQAVVTFPEILPPFSHDPGDVRIIRTNEPVSPLIYSRSNMVKCVFVLNGSRNPTTSPLLGLRLVEVSRTCDPIFLRFLVSNMFPGSYR